MTKNRFRKKFSAVKDDIFVSSRSNASDAQIHCITTFDSKIDTNLFKKSLIYTIRKHPILACRYVASDTTHSYWEENLELNIEKYHQLIETTESKNEIEKFITTPLDFSEGPIFRVLVLRNKTDILCFKVSHVLADAGGIKELIGEISGTYSNLESNIPFNIQTSTADRSLHSIYKKLSYLKKIKVLYQGVHVYINKNYPKRNWSLSGNPDQQKNKVILKLYINRSEFKSLKFYCKKNRVTLNDILTAAIFRSLHKLIQPFEKTPLRIISTVDLRRYYLTNKLDSISNCASLIYINIGKSIGRDIFETISKVRGAMHWRSNTIGLESHLFSIKKPNEIPYWLYTMINQLAKFFNSKINKTSILPVFTNMGNIDNNIVKFGSSNAVDAYFTAPIASSPGLIIGASGFNNSLTITSGFCENAMTKASMELLFTNISKEINKVIQWSKVCE